MSAFWQVVNPVIGLTLNVLSQILVCRYISRLGVLKSVYLGFMAGFASVLALEIYISAKSPAGNFFPMLFTNEIIYSVLGYSYFHFINLGETARRIRIIRELYDSPEGLSLEEILKRYDSRKMVEMRIKRLVGNGQVVFRGNRYYIGKPVMLTMAKIIVAMKLIVLGKRSEFD